MVLSARMARRRAAAVVALVAVAATGLAFAGPAVAASTLGIDKNASVTSASPGQDFTYTIVPRCSGLTESCVNATVVDVLPPQVEVTALPPSTTDRTVTFDAATRTLRIQYKVPLSSPAPPGAIGLPAGSSNNVELGVRIPEASQIADGTVITNTASVTADNAPTATDQAPVTADVPRVATAVATKTWSDGTAVAGTGEASSMSLGVRNASSSTAQVGSLGIDESSPAVFDRFDVTAIGPVTFPPGSDRVTVSACRVALSACTDADYVTSPPQSGPALSLPAGVSAADVTGLRFVFTNAALAAIPSSPTAGSVQVATVLRDTLRSTGAPYRPTSRDDVNNCVTPQAVDPVLGTVAGVPACAPYAVQPAQATMSLAKTFFSDTNADYTADGQAVIGQDSLVSGLVTATNTSPFPVSTVTIEDPSPTTPAEFAKVNVTSVRLSFPAGATQAELVFDCAGTLITRQFVPPPTVVSVPVPCQAGRADGVRVVYSGTDPVGNGTIAAGAAAVLGVQGQLNENVTAADVVGGASAGVQNCAAGTATSSINGVGSAAAGGCATVAVQPAVARVTGVKSAELATILPGLPRRFSLSFTNNGTIPATVVTLADPGTPTATNNPFDTLRLASLTLPATPAATAEVYDPQAGSYVPYDAANAALLERSRGFRVVLAQPLPPGQRYALSASVLLRDGVPTGTRIQNCASVGSAEQTATNFCAPAITATEPSEGASVQKAISPASTVRPQPGLPAQTVQVKLAAQNTGTLWLKRLVVTDTDPAFFDAVDVTGTVRVNFPPSANRVQVDVCTTDCAAGVFVLGTPTASRTPALPAGVLPSDIRGVRVTFTVADGSFTIKPGSNFPTSGDCTAASVCIDVTPRATLRSNPATATGDTLTDTASGGYETTRQAGVLAPVPSSSSTLTLTSGTAALRFDKSPDVALGPGDPTPFTLSVTNTGTGPLPDPVIVDPLPSRLEFAPSDPSQPFTFTVNQPAGAPASPEPVFEPTTDSSGKVTALRWRFLGLALLPGGTVTVTFQAQLAPGVVAGSAIDNTAGGSASRPDLSCASGGRRPGTATDDPAYGTGLFCTSTNRTTTLAGNAIRTEKWVAGDTTLGWMNSLTGSLLPIGDPGCPRLDVDGVSFTRYPCVARVAPGQGFDFYLRMTNAGTNPATEIRVVDVFPAPGDTGVILTGESRGTQWKQAPILLGPLALVGPGSLAAAYTTASPACTTDLNRPPVACAAGAWSDAYASNAAAFRGLVTFTDPLGPGGSTALRFRMQAPPVPIDPVDDMVAWNSFAHTEFFREAGGRIVQLPATEPIKTGVAMVFGSLTVQKVLADGATGGPFALHYRCTVTPEGPAGQALDPVVAVEDDFTLDGGENVTFTGIPARASCSVWETDAAGLLSDTLGEANAKVVTIPVNRTETVPVVSVTNRAQPTMPTTSTASTTSATPSTTAPTTPPTTSPTTTGSSPSGTSASSPPAASAGQLGATGLSPVVAWIAVLGVVLLVAGGVLVLSTRLRRR